MDIGSGSRQADWDESARLQSYSTHQNRATGVPQAFVTGNGADIDFRRLGYGAPELAMHLMVRDLSQGQLTQNLGGQTFVPGTTLVADPTSTSSWGSTVVRGYNSFLTGAPASGGAYTPGHPEFYFCRPSAGDVAVPLSSNVCNGSNLGNPTSWPPAPSPAPGP